MPNATPDADERDQRILDEHLAGRRQREIAERHELSRESVRLIVQRQLNREITVLECALLRSRCTDEPVELATLGHDLVEFETAANYTAAVLTGLLERGVRVRLHYRPTSEGVVIALQEVQ